MCWKLTYHTWFVWVERTPDLKTAGNRYAEPYPNYPTRLCAKALIDIKDNCLFHMNCAIFFMSAVFIVSEFWKLLPDQLVSTGHISLNKVDLVLQLPIGF